MNISSILNGVAIGKDTTGNFRITPEGLAVRTTSDGPFFVRKEDALLDVTDVTLDQTDGFTFRLPVQKDDLNGGDLIITSDNPFAVLSVISVLKSGHIHGVDIGSRQEVKSLPPTNLFLNVPLFVKVFNPLSDFSGGPHNHPDLALLLLLLTQGGDASSTNDLLPLLLLGRGSTTRDKDLLPFLLLKGDGSTSALSTILLLSAVGGSGGLFSGISGAKSRRRKPGAARKPGGQSAGDKKNG